MRDAPSWTLMSSAPKEERLLPVAEALELFSVADDHFLLAPDPPPVHSCTAHTPLRRCNVRKHLLTTAVWRALRSGSSPLGAIDRDRPQQRPCLDIEAATSG